MRSLARSVAALLALAACGPNPYFKLQGEGNGGSDTVSGASETGDTSSGGTTGSSPGLPCEPAPDAAVADACDPWQPFPYPVPPNLAVTDMLKDFVCGEANDVSIMRVGDSTLELCDAGCQNCQPERSIAIDGVLDFALLKPHLPPSGVCTRLWHIAKPTPTDLQAPCKSVAYAFWDAEGDRQLRLAFASGSDDPFAGVTDWPLTFEPQAADVCVADQVAADNCELGANVTPMKVTVDDCEFTIKQGELWRNIPIGDLHYDLELRAFSCVAGDTTSRRSWYLRRSDP